MTSRRLSEEIHKNISEFVPAGVDGNAKIFPGSVPVVECSVGCRLTDVDGNVYIDYCAGYGPLIFGHAYEKVNHHRLSRWLLHLGL